MKCLLVLMKMSRNYLAEFLDAKEKMQMGAADIRAHYFELQRWLYCA
ncbi:MAG: hypothetical protein IKQ46_10905 [Bacteroidales bacterium]|nr:hypothetical protein [Bacteroidales bacterium]